MLVFVLFKAMTNGRDFFAAWRSWPMLPGWATAGRVAAAASIVAHGRPVGRHEYNPARLVEDAPNQESSV